MRSPEAQNLELSEADEMRAVVLLILAGAAIRTLSFFCSANTGGDAPARVALTAAWLQHPNWKVIFDTYPPGHFWLIGALALLLNDAVLAGRLLSLLLGIGSLILVWKLTRLLFGASAALFALVVFSLHSLHIAYSTTSSSEIPYLFFMLLSVLLMFSHLQESNGALWKLAASGFSISISGSIRFEAWVILVALFLILAIYAWYQWRREHTLKAAPLFSLAIFGATGGAWPAFMMWYCDRNFGDPFYLVTWTQIRVQHLFAVHPSPRIYQLSLMPGVLVITLGPLAVVAAIYGLVKSFALPLPRAFSALTVFFLAVQYHQLLKGATVAVARYTLTVAALLAVLAGFGCDLIRRKFAPARMRLAVLVLFVLMAGNALAILVLSEVPNRYSAKFASVSPRLRYPTRVAGVGKYLREHLGPEDSVVLDDYNAESNVLADAAGLPVLSERAYEQDRKNEISALQYVAARHPRFVVYSDHGSLAASFSLPANCADDADIIGVHFHCVFANRVYRIYQLSY